MQADDAKPGRTWVPTVAAVLAAALTAAALAAIITAMVMQVRFAAMMPGGAPGGMGEMAGLPPALVNMGQARVEPMRDRFEVIGRLREVQRATVAAEVEGKVVAVPVEQGDPITGGQTVLAQIEDVWAKLALRAAKADAASRRATLDQSERDLAQLEYLHTANSAKPKEVDDARAEVDSDRAALDAAIAERDRAQQRVDRLRVLAPFDGQVVIKLTEIGQWVQPGAPIAEVISRGQIDAVVDVPERLVNEVRVGDTLPVIVDSLSIEASGEVVSVTPSASAAARTFPVKVRLDDLDGKLKAGMSASVQLPVGEQSHYLTVPRDAVQFSGLGATVWVANPPAEEGGLPTALPVPVDVRFGQGERFVIEPVGADAAALLTDQTTVVLQGAERLIPTQPLMPAEPRAARVNEDDPTEAR